MCASLLGTALLLRREMSVDRAGNVEIESLRIIEAVDTCCGYFDLVRTRMRVSVMRVRAIDLDTITEIPMEGENRCGSGGGEGTEADAFACRGSFRRVYRELRYRCGDGSVD